jgi:hypothetical protein
MPETDRQSPLGITVNEAILRADWAVWAGSGDKGSIQLVCEVLHLPAIFHKFLTGNNLSSEVSLRNHVPQIFDVAGCPEEEQDPTTWSQVFPKLFEESRQGYVVFIRYGSLFHVSCSKPSERRVEDDEIKSAVHILKKITLKHLNMRADRVALSILPCTGY